MLIMTAWRGFCVCVKSYCFSCTPLFLFVSVINFFRTKQTKIKSHYSSPPILVSLKAKTKQKVKGASLVNRRMDGWRHSEATDSALMTDWLVLWAFDAVWAATGNLILVPKIARCILCTSETKINQSSREKKISELSAGRFDTKWSADTSSHQLQTVLTWFVGLNPAYNKCLEWRP